MAEPRPMMTNARTGACVGLALLLFTACSDSATPDDGDGGGDTSPDVGGDAPTGDTPTGDTPTGDLGSATLTIGDETWQFDQFGCAFGHDATESDIFSFSSSAFGEHSSGARVQMQAEIRDETGQGRYEGDGVIYEVYVRDIDDFETPAVHWESTNDENPQLVELGLEPPSGDTVVAIDGDSITAEGFFDDKLTETEFERAAGTLTATCGVQSRR